MRNNLKIIKSSINQPHGLAHTHQGTRFSAFCHFRRGRHFSERNLIESISQGQHLISKQVCVATYDLHKSQQNTRGIENGVGIKLYQPISRACAFGLTNYPTASNKMAITCKLANAYGHCGVTVHNFPKQTKYLGGTFTA
jgi:hypothetical protein